MMLGEDEMGVAGVGGVFGDVDWDHFLSNPGAYTVESEGVVALAPVADGDEAEEQGADVEEADDDEMEQDMDLEEEYEEQGNEEEEEVDINTLMGGLQVGQEQVGNQQVFQQAAEAEEDDEINLAEYLADEDVGEDERTKKLRDWFRPW
jgi:hypothetical protein